MTSSMFRLPKFIWDRGNTERGRIAGATRHCQLDGCRGLRIRVVWDNGRSTWHCSKGLRELNATEWQIQ